MSEGKSATLKVESMLPFGNFNTFRVIPNLSIIRICAILFKVTSISCFWLFIDLAFTSSSLTIMSVDAGFGYKFTLELDRFEIYPEKCSCLNYE